MLIQQREMCATAHTLEFISSWLESYSHVCHTFPTEYFIALDFFHSTFGIGNECWVEDELKVNWILK